MSTVRAILCCKNAVVKTKGQIRTFGSKNQILDPDFVCRLLMTWADARKSHFWNGCTQGYFLCTDARNQKDHFDGCTQWTFGLRMRARYGANPGCAKPTSRMHATSLISRRPNYLLIVESHHCVMCFSYALHMSRQNRVLLSCLYTEPFEIVIEIVFIYCITPFYHKIDLFKRPFRGSCSKRLDDAFVLLIILIVLYPQKSSFVSDDRKL